MSLGFDPSLLPDPTLLSALRDQNRPMARPTGTANWYTPMLLFGAIGTVPPTIVSPGIVGRIPVIETCTPIGWYLSSNAATNLELSLGYTPPPAALASADPLTPGPHEAVDNPVDPAPALVDSAHRPSLAGSRRRVYEETPVLTGWRSVLDRYSEITISVVSNTAAEQVLFVLYLLKVRLR